MLNRDSVRDGFLYRKLLEYQDRIEGIRPLTDAERLDSLRRTLAKAPAGDVWVFGYGSLMWNPAFDFSERRSGRVYGLHRAYCMWTPLGRGSPENPGMMLALDRGGSCHGVAFRLHKGREEEELSIVWAREMLLDSYRPVWVRVHTDSGRKPVHGITFAVKRGHIRYAGKQPHEVMVRHLATAEGYLGTSREYLENTVAHLDELGLHDKTLHRLHREVAAYAGAGKQE